MSHSMRQVGYNCAQLCSAPTSLHARSLAGARRQCTCSRSNSCSATPSRRPLGARPRARCQAATARAVRALKRPVAPLAASRPSRCSARCRCRTAAPACSVQLVGRQGPQHDELYTIQAIDSLAAKQQLRRLTGAALTQGCAAADRRRPPADSVLSPPRLSLR